MSEISNAVAKRNQNTTTQESSLEKQLDAAEFYGMIPPEKSNNQPRKRGRPNKSPGPSTRTSSSSSSHSEDPTPEKVAQAVDDLKKRALVSKLKAFACYWPELCGPSLSNLNINLCSIQQLEDLLEAFESSVQTESEIINIPGYLRSSLHHLETLGLGVAMQNPEHPYLSQGRYLQGLSEAINSSPGIDRNIKLIAIRFIGIMPKNPFVSLIIELFSCASACYRHNIEKEAFQVKKENIKFQYA